MLIQLTGMSGHPLAVEAADVHAVEAIFNDEILLKHPDNSVGSRLHCNRHGVTSQFDVRELVEEVLLALRMGPDPSSVFCQCCGLRWEMHHQSLQEMAKRRRERDTAINTAGVFDQSDGTPWTAVTGKGQL